jgi:glucan 1,3-beta-glucosidase
LSRGFPCQPCYLLRADNRMTRWITPSLFQYPDSAGVKDEYTLTQHLGAQKAYNDVLKPHWDSWVSWQDFKRIKDAGFNLVRLPVGFWAYDTFGAPYSKGAAPYVDAAIDWARSVGLKMIIDLHGAPGSQNGFDNSGHLTTPAWLQGDTSSQTVDVLATIAEKYAQKSYQDVVVGIQLLNEPLMEKLGNDNGVRDYYSQGYDKVRKISDTTVVIHDGFKKATDWNGFLTPSGYNAQNVALDHHEYQVFDNNMVGWQPWQHRQYVCNNVDQYSNSDKWTFVGEWTGAMTDCATYLNGAYQSW